MVWVPSVAIAKSLCPSQLKSPIATSCGSRFVVYERAIDALAVEAIAAVVESNISMTSEMLRARLLRWWFLGIINITILPQPLLHFNSFAFKFSSENHKLLRSKAKIAFEITKNIFRENERKVRGD